MFYYERSKEMSVTPAGASHFAKDSPKRRLPWRDVLSLFTQAV